MHALSVILSLVLVLGGIEFVARECARADWSWLVFRP